MAFPAGGSYVAQCPSHQLGGADQVSGGAVGMPDSMLTMKEPVPRGEESPWSLLRSGWLGWGLGGVRALCSHGAGGASKWPQTYTAGAHALGSAKRRVVAPCSPCANTPICRPASE